MSLSVLCIIITAPKVPSEARGDWSAIEERLGTKLPADYKKFIETFGTGKVDDFLVILNPFSSNKFVNLYEKSKREIEAYGQVKSQFPQYYSHNAYPQLDGILPFGSTDNGDMICWLTSGEPDHWSVVVYDARGPEYFSYSGNATSFLAAVLEKVVRCSVFPGDFPSNRPTFSSF